MIIFEQLYDTALLFTPPPLFFVALVTCLPCHSCYHGVPDTQGRRVPALALTIPTHVGTILEPQMGPQIGSKIAQKPDLGHPSRPRDAKGRPEASREQFLGLQGLILEPFWDQFGAVW